MMTMKSWLAGLAAVTATVLGAALAVPAAASATARLPQHGGEKKATSPSWAGYVAQARKGQTFRYVAADLTFPAPNYSNMPPAGQNNSALQWIGLNGYHDGPARQIGLSETCDIDTDVAYYAWYQGPSGPVDFISCTDLGRDCLGGVNPGDRIELSIYYNGKSYRLTFRDVNTNVFRKFYQPCLQCRNSSAEAINQFFYAGGDGQVSTGFSGIRVTGTSGRHGTMAAQPGYWTSTRVTMVNPSGRPLSVVSALLRHGRAFRVSAWGPGPS